MNQSREIETVQCAGCSKFKTKSGYFKKEWKHRNCISGLNGLCKSCRKGMGQNTLKLLQNKREQLKREASERKRLEDMEAREERKRKKVRAYIQQRLSCPDPPTNHPDEGQPAKDMENLAVGRLSFEEGFCFDDKRDCTEGASMPLLSGPIAESYNIHNVRAKKGKWLAFNIKEDSPYKEGVTGTPGKIICHEDVDHVKEIRYALYHTQFNDYTTDEYHQAFGLMLLPRYSLGQPHSEDRQPILVVEHEKAKEEDWKDAFEIASGPLNQGRIRFDRNGEARSFILHYYETYMDDNYLQGGTEVPFGLDHDYDEVYKQKQFKKKLKLKEEELKQKILKQEKKTQMTLIQDG